MAADFNLSNQYISASFDNLMQNSGSIPVNGLGTEISNLTVTSSFATTASYAINSANQVSASYADRAGIADAVSGSNVVGNVATASFALTASVVTGTVTSASYAISASQAELANNATNATNATSASHALASNTSISASHALNSDNSISSSYALTATSASHALVADLAADANDLIVGVKNTLGVTITKGQTLHATGVTGQNIDVITASNATGNMPAIGLALADINAGASGNAIISGKIIGINTTGFTAGNNVYVGVDGALTATKPTGSALIQNIGVVGKVDSSDGELVVLGSGRSNDLPNISQGYLWVGNGDSVATAVTSQSLWTGKDISVNSITASGATFTSASIGYLRTVTGSATIIGDEYIILNADSPTKRFAGIKVYDSGSSLTGSFEWDSVDDNWIQVETGGESAGMLTGISGSKGSEVYPTLNTIIKGTGNHTVQDSIITDNGTQVTVAGIMSASAFVGDGSGLTNISAPTATSASYAVSASFAQTASYVTPLVQDVIVTGSVTISGSSGYELTTQGDVNFNLTQPGNNQTVQVISAPGFTGTAGVNNGKTITINELVYQNFPAFGATYENSYMFSQWDGFGYNYGMDFSVGASRINALVIASGSGTNAQRSAAFSTLNDTNASNTPEGDAVARYYGRTMELGQYNSETIAIGNNIVVPQGYTTANTHLTAEDKVIIGSTVGTSYPYKGVTRSFQAGAKPTKDIEFYYTGSTSFIQSGSAVKPAVQITGSLQITGSGLNKSTIVGNLKQSFPSPGNNNSVGLYELTGTNTIDSKTYTNKNFFLADFNSFGEQFRDYFSLEYYDGFGYNYGSELNINGIKSRLATVASGSGGFASRQAEISTIDDGDGTGTVAMSAGDQVDLKLVAGNKGISVTGSVHSEINALSIASNTASLDCQDGDMFTLTLVSGSNTHLNASNIRAGQTISLKVLQPSTATDSYGTMTFESEFKFAGGTSPTITAASGSTDILTFQSYDASSLFTTAVQNLS